MSRDRQVSKKSSHPRHESALASSAPRPDILEAIHKLQNREREARRVAKESCHVPLPPETATRFQALWRWMISDVKNHPILRYSVSFCNLKVLAHFCKSTTRAHENKNSKKEKKSSARPE